MRDRPAVKIKTYTVYCGDADANEKKAGVNPFTSPEEQQKMGSLKLQLEAGWDVAFDSDHRPVFSALTYGSKGGNEGVLPQPKVDMAGLKDEECRTNFRQRLSIHVADAALETLPVQIPPKKFTFASEMTRSRTIPNFRRQLHQNRGSEWTSRAKEFEKAWEDKNPRKAYALLNSEKIIIIAAK
ncbi:hypothetical protein RB195_022107 [Necator americanus]|uniref:Uncharacterized protein n=1 Tax=Necator americanus TaxID=51031 RepID=A0ABR1EE15_NECAM